MVGLGPSRPHHFPNWCLHINFCVPFVIYSLGNNKVKMKSYNNGEKSHNILYVSQY